MRWSAHKLSLNSQEVKLFHFGTIVQFTVDNGVVLIFYVRIVPNSLTSHILCLVQLFFNFNFSKHAKMH